MKTKKVYSMEWAGRPLTFEFGKLALQADSSVVVRYADTVVLATAVMSESVREGQDFFPLTVDYEERMYAAGKIKGSRFIKREGRPTDEAILTARLIDRAIRPLFDDRIRNEVQVVITVLSVDKENDPDILALIGAAAALHCSQIPWAGPIAGIRVGRVGGEYVINPTHEARVKSDIDLVVAGTTDRVVMLEAGAKEVGEEEIASAIEFGQKHLRAVMDLIEAMRADVGREKIAVEEPTTIVEEDGKVVDEQAFLEDARAWIKGKLGEVLFDSTKQTKAARGRALGVLEEELDAYLITKQIGKERRREAIALVEPLVEAAVRDAILTSGKRVDGRGLTDIRPLGVEVGVLPQTHGSGLFSRGETQVLSIVTLGAPGDVQVLDSMEESGKKRYMHHYNFPGFAVGEVKPIRGAGRREIGHGALAERALEPVLPSEEVFPYTIRVVSETLGSNGSSSMASTCGSTLSLMDAGVPITSPVAGIAMGLASNEATGEYKILTDLQDLEDGKGGMDFKVAGTRQGITAIQMDTKTKGLTKQMVRETLIQSREGRLSILEAMEKVIPQVRVQLSPFAPRITTITINPEKIREVIGPGGKVINDIINKTGVDIDIEQDGRVMITSAAAEGMERAIQMVNAIVAEPEVGTIYEGTVTRIMDFGAFVEILPNKEGLVHISELSEDRVEKVEDVVHVGDMVKVKLVEIDNMGRLNLSIRQTNPHAAARERKMPGTGNGGERRDRRNAGGFRGGDRPRGRF